MKILIIGASGFLGSFLFHNFKKQYHIVGTYFTKQYKDYIHLDLANKSQLTNLFTKTNFDIIINCGGFTRPDYCEKNKKLAYKVNVESIEDIIKLSNAKIIYFSTDYVFDGKKEKYTEDDKTNPINIYGKTKLLAENIVLQNPKNVVIRISGLYGFNSYNNEFINSLQNNKIEKAIDLYGSTLLLNDVQKFITDFFYNFSGIFHFSSQSSISRYEFVELALKILKIQTKVIGKYSKKLDLIAKRPRNTTLYSNKITYPFLKEENGLKFIYNQIKNRR